MKKSLLPICDLPHFIILPQQFLHFFIFHKSFACFYNLKSLSLLYIFRIISSITALISFLVNLKLYFISCSVPGSIIYFLPKLFKFRANLSSTISFLCFGFPHKFTSTTRHINKIISYILRAY